jgi:hypothetical protein
MKRNSLTYNSLILVALMLATPSIVLAGGGAKEYMIAAFFQFTLITTMITVLFASVTAYYRDNYQKKGKTEVSSRLKVVSNIFKTIAILALTMALCLAVFLLLFKPLLLILPLVLMIIVLKNVWR